MLSVNLSLVLRVFIPGVVENKKWWYCHAVDASAADAGSARIPGFGLRQVGFADGNIYLQISGVVSALVAVLSNSNLRFACAL